MPETIKPLTLIAASPVPFEALSAPGPGLDGSQGGNRGRGHCQLAAADDVAAVQAWLSEFVDSPQTWRSYRKEAERLLLWCWLVAGKALSDLQREDLQRYQQFLKQPRPASRWCGPRASRDSPQWRPFQGPLSPASQAQALIIINSLFTYLVTAGYLAGNPMGLVRRKLKTTARSNSEATSRYLDQALWQRVWQYIEQLPQETGANRDRAERLRYLFTLLYSLGPRVNELASHPMGSVQCVRGRWWWFVTGKGSKAAKVPVTPSCLAALQRYRTYLGWAALPTADDMRPLVPSQKGSRGISANMIYRLVKTLFAEVADSLQPDAPDLANTLRRASTHWMRHTAITHLADRKIDIRFLNKTARHEKLETTAIYLHAEDDAWHDAISGALPQDASNDSKGPTQ